MSKLVEHVQLMTKDQVRLDGLYTAVGSDQRQFAFDAVVLLHGLLGNFYNSRLLNELSERFAAAGVAALRINTRGHDGINITPRGLAAIRMGSAYEIVDDCRWDIAASAQWMTERGHQRVCLLGHSLGAIKTLYSQSVDANSEIKALIALSATRLNFDQFASTSKADEFIGNYERAQKLVDSGAGQELISIDFPFSTVICAEAYVDKYGPESRYDWIEQVHSIKQKTLLLFGEKELGTPAFHGLIEELESKVYDRDLIDLKIVEKADHYYTGAIDSVWQAISQWNSG
jgi:pimeloyl-ACP methyl ester carboxylesterase